MKYILTFVTSIETLRKRSGIKYEKNNKAFSISVTLSTVRLYNIHTYASMNTKRDEALEIRCKRILLIFYEH